MTTIGKINTLLEKHSQKHLIHDVEQLTSTELEILLKQLQYIDTCINLLDNTQNSEILKWSESFIPLEKCSETLLEDFQIGELVVEKGKVGCVLLAGGEGTRLGYFKPKGMFPMSALNDKSLFQILVEKIRLAQKKYQKKLYLALMVNPITSEKIVSFFEENHFFGLEKNQIDFFLQEMLPFFDENKKWFWKEKGVIAEGTEGNGRIFEHFYKSSIYQKWDKLGIEFASIIPVDNPLVDPFNEQMIGLHQRSKADVTICCIPSKKGENMGGLALVENNIRVLEYVYFGNRQIPTHLSNTGIYLVSLDYIGKIHTKHLPLHKIQKSSPVWCRESVKNISSYKYEQFIFDAFVFSENVSTYLSTEDQCFAPLKDQSDIERINQILIKTDKKLNLIKNF